MNTESNAQNAENYDPSELLTVCETILEDGEISGDELYQLAEWLNNHREACFHWPGNLLVGPLQEAWADGQLTTTELQQIGRLLLQIRKDWARRQADALFAQATEIVTEVIRGIDLSQPRLPAIPIVVRVKSHSDGSTVYDVDLSGPTCACGDWRSRRHSLPEGHLSRCCKHVFDAYGQLEPEGGWPGWFGAFLALSYTPHPQQEWMVLQIKTHSVLVSTAPTGWANVFAPDRGRYERYGYNPSERRWAYGMEPTGSDSIRKAIARAGNR